MWHTNLKHCMNYVIFNGTHHLLVGSFKSETSAPKKNMDHQWSSSCWAWTCLNTNICPTTRGHNGLQGKLPSGYVKIAIEHGHLKWIFPLKMVIFHSYVSLPEGTTQAIHSQRDQFYGSVTGPWPLHLDVAVANRPGQSLDSCRPLAPKGRRRILQVFLKGNMVANFEPLRHSIRSRIVYL